MGKKIKKSSAKPKANKTERLNLENFILKAKDREANKEKLFLLDVEGFGEIEFRRPTTREIIKYIDSSTNAVQTDKEGNAIETDMELLFDGAKEFVYQTCSFLQSKELRTELEIENPLDAAFKVFGINGTNELANRIYEKVDGSKKVEEVEETIKN